MNWTTENIKLLIQYLLNHKTVSSAVESFNADNETEVTPAGARAAFYRHGYSCPSSYLSEEPDPTPDQLERLRAELQKSRDDIEAGQFTTLDEVVFAVSDNLRWSPFAKHYEYLQDGTSEAVVITAEQMDEAVICYQKNEGLDMTARQVADFMGINHEELNVLDTSDWAAIFKGLGQTKYAEIDVPHEPEPASVKRFAEIREARAGLIKKQKAASEVQWMRGRVASLERELSELSFLSERAQDVADSIPGRKQLAKRTKLLIDDKVVVPIGKRVRAIFVPDLHVGKHVKMRGKGAKPQNVFNKDILRSRVGEIVTMIRDLPDWDQVSHVHIAGLGDAFEALLANMREGQFTSVDVWGEEQYRIVVESLLVISDAVLETVKEKCGPEVSIKFVLQPGNHDRLAKEKASQSELVLNAILAERIQREYLGEPRIEVVAGAQVVTTVFEDIGWEIISQHGHLKSPKTYPQITNFKDLFTSGAKRTLILQAHLHNLKILTGHDWRYICVSSLCGNDDFNLTQLHVGSEPEMVFVDLHEQGDLILGPFKFTK